MNWNIIGYIVYAFLALASIWVLIKKSSTGMKLIGIGGLIIAFVSFAPVIGIIIANGELMTILQLGSILLIGIGMIMDR
jgi:hypothetical protein